jgi:hypothetical protein
MFGGLEDTKQTFFVTLAKHYKEELKSGLSFITSPQ